MLHKYLVHLSVVVMGVLLQGCISRYYPLLTPDDLEWVEGLERQPELVLEADNGEKLRFHFKPTELNNAFLQVHLNEGKGWSSGPGNAYIRFKCFSSRMIETIDGAILFEANPESDYPCVHFRIGNLFTLSSSDGKLPILDPCPMTIESKRVNDCYTFTVGVNLENAYNRQSKIRQVVISKQYGIIYVAFVDGTEFYSRDLFFSDVK